MSTPPPTYQSPVRELSSTNSPKDVNRLKKLIKLTEEAETKIKTEAIVPKSPRETPKSKNQKDSIVKAATANAGAKKSDSTGDGTKKIRATKSKTATECDGTPQTETVKATKARKASKKQEQQEINNNDEVKKRSRKKSPEAACENSVETKAADGRRKSVQFDESTMKKLSEAGSLKKLQSTNKSSEKGTKDKNQEDKLHLKRQRKSLAKKENKIESENTTKKETETTGTDDVKDNGISKKPRTKNKDKNVADDSLGSTAELLKTIKKEKDEIVKNPFHGNNFGDANANNDYMNMIDEMIAELEEVENSNKIPNTNLGKDLKLKSEPSDKKILEMKMKESKSKAKLDKSPKKFDDSISELKKGKDGPKNELKDKDTNKDSKEKKEDGRTQKKDTKKDSKEKKEDGKARKKDTKKDSKEKTEDGRTRKKKPRRPKQTIKSDLKTDKKMARALLKMSLEFSGSSNKILDMSSSSDSSSSSSCSSDCSCRFSSSSGDHCKCWECLMRPDSSTDSSSDSDSSSLGDCCKVDSDASCICDLSDSSGSENGLPAMACNKKNTPKTKKARLKSLKTKKTNKKL